MYSATGYKRFLFNSKYMWNWQCNPNRIQHQFWGCCHVKDKTFPFPFLGWLHPQWAHNGANPSRRKQPLAVPHHSRNQVGYGISLGPSPCPGTPTSFPPNPCTGRKWPVQLTTFSVPSVTWRGQLTDVRQPNSPDWLMALFNSLRPEQGTCITWGAGVGLHWECLLEKSQL